MVKHIPISSDQVTARSCKSSTMDKCDWLCLLFACWQD